MRRLFWVALGATIGVVVMRRVNKVVHAYSPTGVAASIGDGLTELGHGLREMASVVREGMAERETELRYALGIDTDTLGGPGARSPGSQLTTDEARALISDPAGPRARPG